MRWALCFVKRRSMIDALFADSMGKHPLADIRTTLNLWSLPVIAKAEKCPNWGNAIAVKHARLVRLQTKKSPAQWQGLVGLGEALSEHLKHIAG